MTKTNTMIIDKDNEKIKTKRMTKTFSEQPQKAVLGQQKSPPFWKKCRRRRMSQEGFKWKELDRNLRAGPC